MPLQQLQPGANPAAFDVQDSDFSHDILGRYICNNWSELEKQRVDGGFPFDAVVIGAGMFGGYIAERLYRHGALQASRILLIEAGAFLLPTHIQNLPQRLGGKIGGPDNARTRDTGTQNVIWGMPWISNERFLGLAYCIGGRSLFWGGWSPRLTPNDLNNWPGPITNYLNGPGGNDGAYRSVEQEIGTFPSTDYIVQSGLYQQLDAAFQAALLQANVLARGVTSVGEAPLAVQGAAPATGVFSFDKFSSGPFVIDAIRNDVATNVSHGDVSRRIFLLPRTRVLSLNRGAGGEVTGLNLLVNGQQQPLPIAPTCAVVLANGTIEATRLALESLGVGNLNFGSPRVGNLMAHLRSNITVRIQLAAPANTVETAAFLARGEMLGRRYHHQVIASTIIGNNPESALWSMIPDIELLDNMLASRDPNWVTITFRGIGEMEDLRLLVPDPARSWIDLSNETDGQTRRAYVNLIATQNDRDLWTAMDNAAFTLAQQLAQELGGAAIEYLTPNGWQAAQPQADAQGDGFWRDILGSTHHEAGTLFMGAAPGNSITNLDGRFHGVPNAYVAGPALFPTLGSHNPSLTGIALARRTADALLAAQRPAAGAGAALSLNLADWQMVGQGPNSPATMRHYGNSPGSVLETFNGYGLYFYTGQQFANFILRLEWRVGRRDDNSGVFIRTPGPAVANALTAAVDGAHGARRSAQWPALRR